MAALISILLVATPALAIGDPPVAVDQTATTSTSVSFILDASDPEGDPLTFVVVTPPANGTLDCTDGLCTYTPPPGFIGDDSFTWKANDGTSDSNLAAFTITVIGNQPPEAQDQSESLPASPTVLSLLALDPEVDPLTFTILSPPAHGTLGGALDDCSDGTCTYTPAAGYSGPDSFTWKANDGTNDSNVATFSLTIRVTWSALEIAQAIASPSAIVTDAAFTPPPSSAFANGVYTAPLGGFSGFPLDGPTLGILTSGDVASVAQPGTFASTSNGGSNVRGDSDLDVSILKIVLDIPQGANCLSFNFKFLSEEFPVFVGSGYNDAFIAELDTSDWTTSGSIISAPHNFAFDEGNNVVSINSTGLGGMTAANGVGTAFDGTTTDLGADPNGAATALLGAATPITPGTHSLYLSIFDQGDTSLDSAVFLDDLRVASVANPDDCQPGATESAHLTLTKILDNTGGGTALDTDWTLSATGPTTISGPTGSTGVTDAVLPPGTYALAEIGPAGYNASAWSCNVGSLDGTNLTLVAGDSGTCSITNTFIPPVAHLTLVKIVENAGGGTAVDTDWILTAVGPTSLEGATGTATVTNAVVTPGTYALAEFGPLGYSASAWNCTAGILTDNSLVLAAGDSATCTVTNTFAPDVAHLWLTKTVDNTGGGTADAFDWTLSATGPITISGIMGSSAVTNAALPPGTYLLAESGPDGYSPIGWGCNVGSRVGNSLTLAAGENGTCSIINTFITGPVNTPPTPIAGPDVSGAEGSPIALDGTVTDPDVGDTLTTTWSYVADPSVDAGASCAIADGTALDTTITCTDDGLYTVTLSASDGHVSVPVTDTATVTVTNANPTVDITAPTAGASFGTGVSVSVSASLADPGANDTLTCSIAWGDGSTTSPASLSAGVCTASHSYTSVGDKTITVTATDDDTGTGSDSVGITITNTPPTPSAGPDVSGAEGSPISLDGSVSDPDIGDTLTTSWTYTADPSVDAGASCAFADAAAVDTTITCTDDGLYTVTLSASDGHVAEPVTDTATVTVTNANPTVDITTPTAGASFGTGASVAVSATLADAGTNDTLTCSIAWGDGSTTSPASLSAGVCSASHTYTSAGDKTITVTATDDDTGTGSDSVGITITPPGGPCSPTDPTTTVERISPPPSVKLNKLTSDVCVRLFDERQDFTLTRTLKVDIWKPGTYDEPRDLTPFLIPKGTIVDSHFLHADNVGRAKVRLEGSVTFDADIIGVIVTDSNLDRSDRLGSPGTRYPDELEQRGLEFLGLDNSGDLVSLSPDLRTLTFNLSFSNVLDSVRVITANGPPTLSIGNETITEGNRGTKLATFEVRLSHVSGQPVTVNYTTVDGTALQPGDYTATAGSLTFAPGVTVMTIGVPIVGDRLGEREERFTVVLSGAVNATIGDGSGLGRIIDNDKRDDNGGQ